MARWGMVIDLRKCFGCRSCAVTCHAVHGIPVDAWRRVEDCGVSAGPARQRLFLPQSCNHCEAPPCFEVCPTGATRQRADGIVDIDARRCLGCGYCMVACPYRARTLIGRQAAADAADALPEPAVADSDSAPVGICSKCDFCLPRLERGLAHGLRPGTDAEATPACVGECSAGALTFGDLDDPDSAVSRLLRENRGARLLEELETGPALYYLVPEGWTTCAMERKG